MKIDSNAAYLYSSQRMQPSNGARSAASSFPASSAAGGGSAVKQDSVSISSAAWAAFNAPASGTDNSSKVSASVEERLAEIKKKDALSRTAEESAYVREHDKRFAEIAASGKGPGELTADETSYMQKAGGFVNTFAHLSSAEKALYDKAVASGDTQAAAGLSQIALTRAGGHMAGGANGTTYDPTNTEITVANIEKFFRHSIVDPSGESASNFQALMRFLQSNSATT